MSQTTAMFGNPNKNENWGSLLMTFSMLLANLLGKNLITKWNIGRWEAMGLVQFKLTKGIVFILVSTPNPKMSELEEFSVRRVTKNDYYKVMDMFPPGEIYDGRDYLPDYFYMLIDMPNREAYAVIIDNRFVSFVLYTIVDDGKSVVSRAGRTRKGYEGRGYSNILYQYFLKHSQQRQEITYEIKTSGRNTKEIKKKLDEGSRTQIIQRHVETYVAYMTDYTRMLQRDNGGDYSAKIIIEAEFGDVLSNQSLCYKLFPEGRLLVDYVPYKTMKSNCILMKTIRTTIVTSNLHDSQSSLLSFLSYYHSVSGLVCVFDLYGNIDSGLKEHLLLHFKYIPTNKPDETVFVSCFCDEDTNWNFVLDIMKSLGLTVYKRTSNDYICTEQKIHHSSNL